MTDAFWMSLAATLAVIGTQGQQMWATRAARLREEKKEAKADAERMAARAVLEQTARDSADALVVCAQTAKDSAEALELTKVGIEKTVEVHDAVNGAHEEALKKIGALESEVRSVNATNGHTPTPGAGESSPTGVTLGAGGHVDVDLSRTENE